MTILGVLKCLFGKHDWKYFPVDETTEDVVLTYYSTPKKPIPKGKTWSAITKDVLLLNTRRTCRRCGKRQKWFVLWLDENN